MDCPGNHRYFVAESVAVESSGKVFVLAICTSCGDAKKHEFSVAQPSEAIRFLDKDKNKKEN